VLSQVGSGVEYLPAAAAASWHAGAAAKVAVRGVGSLRAGAGCSTRTCTAEHHCRLDAMPF